MEDYLMQSALKIFTALAFLSCLQLHTETQDPTTLFLGTIKFPKTLNNSDACLYYKGSKLKTEWDKNNLSTQFSFLESKSSQTLYVLICNNITCFTNLSNTVQHLCLIENQYRCYELQAIRVYDDHDQLTSFSWDCQECDLENGIIPENTVIFLFDPLLVDGLLVHTWNKNQAMRLIPTIKICSSATSAELVRAMTIARLTSIDIDTIHAKEPAKNKTVKAI